MVVRTNWPGATAREVEQQVTDRIEKKLQETPNLDFLRSYSKPGESQIFVIAKDSAPPPTVPETFYQVRKKIGDIRKTLPAGIQGPFFNDEFGDTFGNIYALTGDGFDYAALKERAERIRAHLLRVPDVAKVDLFGVQDEKIFVEMSNTKLATLGVDRRQIILTLASSRMRWRRRACSKPPATASSCAPPATSIRWTDPRHRHPRQRPRVSPGRHRQGLPRLRRPAAAEMRFMGKDALGIGVSMRKGGDIIELGKTSTRRSRAHPAQLARWAWSSPASTTSRARAPRRSTNSSRSLAEAVLIVLAVSFFSLGLRTGIVVALSIPLVLAMTFLFMYCFRHRPAQDLAGRAGAFALGLLVDDAIIAVEMMVVKMEQGWDRMRAASFAWETTAFPMLTGTLVTAAGFLPIATAPSRAPANTRARCSRCRRSR